MNDTIETEYILRGDNFDKTLSRINVYFVLMLAKIICFSLLLRLMLLLNSYAKPMTKHFMSKNEKRFSRY